MKAGGGGAGVVRFMNPMEGQDAGPEPEPEPPPIVDKRDEAPSDPAEKLDWIFQVRHEWHFATPHGGPRSPWGPPQLMGPRSSAPGGGGNSAHSFLTAFPQQHVGHCLQAATLHSAPTLPQRSVDSTAVQPLSFGCAADRSPPALCSRSRWRQSTRRSTREGSRRCGATSRAAGSARSTTQTCGQSGSRA